MSLKILQMSLATSLLVLAAGCTSSNTGDALQAGASPEAQAVAPVVQANCPAVYMLESGAVRQVYAGGASNGTPERLVYQASLGDSTRACSMNGDVLTVHVMAQGRLVPGPQAKSGTVNVPVRVTVEDGDGEVFTNVTQVPVAISSTGEGTQFLFSNNAVTIPNGPGGAPKGTNVYVSFDQGKARR